MSALDSLRSIDIEVLSAINGLAGHSDVADKIILALDNKMIKGGFTATLFCFLWFLPRHWDLRSRTRLISLIVVTMAAIVLGRVLALSLPFRARPLYTEGLVVHGPLADQSILDNWSSFPSDHAPLFFTFAGGFFLVNRLAGLVAFFHAAVIVSLVRVYLGLHYPGDILAGALIGILLSFTLVPLLARWSLLQRTVAAGLERYPYLLYPAIFFVTFQIATLFDPLRIFLSVVGSILEG